MNSITLSYLIATRNRLPYLQKTLGKLIANKKPDEEILVADGSSSDGTKEYLEKLKASGAIDYYISEKDYNVAHGLNKIILRSRGVLFKYITDDDAYDFKTIQKCKEFMMDHPEIDLVNTEAGSLNNPGRMVGQKDTLQVVRSINYKEQYLKWKEDHTPFFFCDLGTVIRKSSLPVVGLLDTASPAPDMEMSVRITSGHANIAWYSGYSYVNISNPKSISLIFMKKIKTLSDRLNKFYFNKNPDSFFVEKLRIIRNKIKSGFSRSVAKQPIQDFEKQWPEIVGAAETWLRIKNTQKKPEFMYKK